jgi:hypothetical protein
MLMLAEDGRDAIDRVRTLISSQGITIKQARVSPDGGLFMGSGIGKGGGDDPGRTGNTPLPATPRPRPSRPKESSRILGDE